jgi:hypothetical protein
MVADDDFGTKACRLLGAGSSLGVGAVRSRKWTSRGLSFASARSAASAEGAAVGALVPVPRKFDAALGAEWIVRAAQAFGTLLGLLCLLAIVDYGVIQRILPRVFSTRLLAWPAPVGNGPTIGPVLVTRHESDLRQEVETSKRLLRSLQKQWSGSRPEWTWSSGDGGGVGEARTRTAERGRA